MLSPAKRPLQLVTLPLLLLLLDLLERGKAGAGAPHAVLDPGYGEAALTPGLAVPVGELNSGDGGEAEHLVTAVIRVTVSPIPITSLQRVRPILRGNHFNRVLHSHNREFTCPLRCFFS